MPKKCQDNDAAIRQVILDAAYKIGMEQGIDRITARRIGAEIGYSTGVIYYHFQNKQEILDILRQNRDKDIYEAVWNCFRPDSTLRENCSRVMECIYQFAISKRDFYTQMFMGQNNSGDRGDVWMDLIRHGLDIASDRREIVSENIETAAYCLYSFFIGYDMLLWRHCPQNAAAAKKMSDGMLDMLFEGILRSSL